jgi:hypothetical protein
MIFRELRGHHRAVLLPVFNLALIKLRASPDVMNEDLAISPLMVNATFIFLCIDLTYSAIPFKIDDSLLHRELHYVEIGIVLLISKHRVRMNQHPRT